VQQMASHFLLSAKARSLSIATVLQMSDTKAEAVFAGIRWPATDGKAVCPHCTCPTWPRPNTLVTKGHFESGLVTAKVCDLAI